MARLLLLEDDQSLIDGLVYALTKEGFAITFTISADPSALPAALGKYVI